MRFTGNDHQVAGPPIHLASEMSTLAKELEAQLREKPEWLLVRWLERAAAMGRHSLVEGAWCLAGGERRVSSGEVGNNVTHAIHTVGPWAM